MKTFFSVKWTCSQICIAGKVRHTKFKKPKTVTGARRWWRATRGGGFVERLRWLSLQASSSGLKSRRGPTNKSSTSLMVNMVCVLYSSYWCTHGPNPIVLCVKEFKQKTCGIKSYQETFVICRCKFDVFFGNTCFLRLHQNLKKMVWMMNNARWTWKLNEPVDIDGTGLLNQDFFAGHWRSIWTVPRSFSRHFQEIKRRRSFIGCRDSVDSDKILDCRMDIKWSSIERNLMESL